MHVAEELRGAEVIESNDFFCPGETIVELC